MTSKHQKMPSASSVSSNSSTSTTSKTAAFFGASHAESAIRPASAAFPSSSSSSSLHRGDSRTSTQFERDERPTSRLNGNATQSGWYEEDIGNASSQMESTSFYASGSAAMAAAHARHLVSMPHAQDAAQLDRSVSSSSALSNGRRSWIDFEGKPIVPLPSPGIAMEDRQLGGPDGVDSTQQYGRFALRDNAQQGLSIDTSMRRAPSTSNSAVALHAARLSRERDAATATDSPKTSSFFRSNSGGLARKLETDISPVSPTPLRRVSDAASLHTPSRYPSISAHHPRPGLSALQEGNTPAYNPISDRPPQISPLVVMGTQPWIPSAYISPPTPDPFKTGAAGEPATVASRNATSRHTHGPSENVTNSSIQPHAELLRHLDLGEDIYRIDPNNSRQTQDDPMQRDSTTGTPRPTSNVTIVESEDEDAARVGSFVIERVLGTGAFSRVVLARRIRGSANAVELAAAAQSRPGTDRRSGLVALKMLEKEPCRQNERMHVSWVREVEVLKHILHPNIVRFLTSYSTTKHHILVLESVEGGELFEYLAQEQRELAQREWLVRRLFAELAGAVGWMHSINLVHRDVKLENIILTRHFRSMQSLTPSHLPDQALVKLSDFGLSRFIDPDSPLLETRCGSEEYAAPELIIGKRYDGRQTDVWALGVVLYALLSGSLPFLSDSAGTIDGSASATPTQGMVHNREITQRRGGLEHDVDARAARKAQLLRIAKGDLRWPAHTNDDSIDFPDLTVCPAQHRLITPSARLLVARLLRRDATKRATAWEIWDERWMREGSFGGVESSAHDQPFATPLDPRSAPGQVWLSVHARVHAGAPDVVWND